MKKIIFITGAGGYLGSNLVNLLSTEIQKNPGSLEVIASDFRPIPEEKKHPGIQYISLDIRDPEAGKIFQKYGVTTVIHLAAIVTPGKDSNRQLEYEVDVMGTKNILEASLAAGVHRIITTSSGAAYGYHPDSPEWFREEDPLRGNYEFAYSHHKKLVEEMMAEYREKFPHLEQVIFRVCTILGDNVNNQITNLFEQKRLTTIRGGRDFFVFIWDQDVVQCLYKSIFSQKTGIYNLAGDGKMSMKEIAQILGKTCISLPAFLVRGVLGILKPLGLSRYGPEQVKFLQYRPVLSNQKLKEVFGYIPQKTSHEVFLYYIEKKTKQNFQPGSSSR